MKRFDCGDIRPEEWLDVMVFRQIEAIHKVLSYCACMSSMLIVLTNDCGNRIYPIHLVI